MPVVTINNNGGGGAPPLARLAFINSYFSNADNETSHDFTSVPFGTDTADRQILVAVMTVGDTIGTISCEIGDDATPELDAQRPGSVNRTAHIFRGRPTGTSGTIRVATTGTFDDVLIAVYRAIDDIIPFQTQILGSNGMTAYNFQLEVPDDGVVLAAAINAGSSDAGLHTWSGLTEDAERGGSTDFRSNSFIAAASAASLTSHAIGQSFESFSLALSQTGAFQTGIIAVAYGVVGDVPTINWTTMYTAGTPSDETNTNVVNDTIRSRFRQDNFIATPPSDQTHIRVTMMAATNEGWACAKSYVGNALLATTTDAVDLSQLLFASNPAFSLGIRAMIASDPLAFNWLDGSHRLQFSYLVANDAGADRIPSQTLSGCPSFIKADVDEADDLTVTGYSSIGSTDFIGVYRIEFGADPASIWTTTMWTFFTSSDNDWSNYTIKHVMTPAAVAADAAIPSHTQMRITFQAADTEALRIDAAYIGHQGGSDAWDAASLTQLTFDGGATFGTAPAGGVLVSDPVTFTYNGTDNLVVSFHCPTDSANTGGGYEAGQTGHQTYYKAASNEAATADASGYSSSTAGRQNMVQRVEFGT